MNIYQSIGSNAGTSEGADLADRLAAWHDAMVAHERFARSGDACSEDCPHSSAGPLWDEAVRTFGERAVELRFLMSRGASRPRGRQRGAAPSAETRA